MIFDFHCTTLRFNDADVKLIKKLSKLPQFQDCKSVTALLMAIIRDYGRLNEKIQNSDYSNIIEHIDKIVNVAIQTREILTK